MTLDEYQAAAHATAIYPGKGSNILYPTLGLCGEAGEVAELVKKMIRDDGHLMTVERREKLILELGDVLWYVAALALELGMSLSSVASRNIDKLASRQANNTLKGSGSDR